MLMRTHVDLGIFIWGVPSTFPATLDRRRRLIELGNALSNQLTPFSQLKGSNAPLATGSRANLAMVSGGRLLLLYLLVPADTSRSVGHSCEGDSCEPSAMMQLFSNAMYSADESCNATGDESGG